MSEHPYFLLNLPNKNSPNQNANQNGKLYLTPCPGTAGANIKASLMTLKNAGAVAVVTLMTEEEMHRNNVSELKTLCEALQLEWLHLPIEDEGAPNQIFETTWAQLGAKIHHHLDANKAVVVHCKGGSGRTGLVAARLLIERGVSKNEAVRQVKALRPNAFLHEVQQQYINGLPSKL